MFIIARIAAAYGIDEFDTPCNDTVMNLSLREIEYVLTVAAEENITRASEKLYIAQPSLSQAIKKIEDEIGHPLFTRVKNKIKLTAEGRLFVESGQQINKTVRDFENKINDLSQNNIGHLALGMPFHLGAFIIPKALSVYKAKYPNISVDLFENTSSELENMILNGTVDLAIMPLPINNPTICFQPFLASRMVIIVSKDNPINAFAYDKGLGEKRCYLDLKKVSKEPFILGNRGQRIRAVTELIFKKAGIAPPIAFYSKNIETIRNIATTGIGLAIIPEQYLKQDDYCDEANAYYLESSQDFQWTIAAAFASSSYRSPAAIQFIRVLHEHIEKDNSSLPKYSQPCCLNKRT